MVGRNRIVAILVACAATLMLAGLAIYAMPGEPKHKLGEGGPLTGDGHLQSNAEHEHQPCLPSELPKFLREHKPRIECVEGSENWFNGDVSKLRRGNKRDSIMWINNHTRDGRGARIVAWGCGHTYKLNDEPPIFGGGAPSSRETNCNMSGHITARETKYNGVYKRNDHASRHHDGGDGGGGGGGGAF